MELSSICRLNKINYKVNKFLKKNTTLMGLCQSNTGAN